QAEDGIRDKLVTGVQTCALPIWQVGLRGRAWKMCGREWADVGVCGSLHNPVSHPGLPGHLDDLRPVPICFPKSPENVHRVGHLRSEERRVGKECSSRGWPYGMNE